MATADPSSAIAAGSRATGAVDARISFFTAVLLFVDATPRAYRLRGSNAPLRFATSTGTSPPGCRDHAGSQGPPDLPVLARLCPRGEARRALCLSRARTGRSRAGPV